MALDAIIKTPARRRHRDILLLSLPLSFNDTNPNKVGTHTQKPGSMPRLLPFETICMLMMIMLLCRVLLLLASTAAAATTITADDDDDDAHAASNAADCVQKVSSSEQSRMKLHPSFDSRAHVPPNPLSHHFRLASYCPPANSVIFVCFRLDRCLLVRVI